MARVFTKNTANYMSLGVSGLSTLLSAAGKISISCRVKLATVSTGVNDNPVVSVIINGSTVGAILNIDGTAGVPKVRVGARSVAGDTRQVKTGATTIAFGVKTYLGGVIDIPGDTITVYTAGANDGAATALAFANATWTLGTPTGHDTVGGFNAPPPDTASQMDGELSEVALWAHATDGLSDANFASLAAGTPADSVRADILVYYLKLAGVTSPEPPTVGTPQGTITGSVPGVSDSASGRSLMMMGVGS